MIDHIIYSSAEHLHAAVNRLANDAEYLSHFK